jgi:hypothetical protein
MTLVLATVTTMFSEDMPLILQVQERPVVMITTQDNITAPSTVTTVRTGIVVVFYMLEVHAASAALSRAAQDFHIVYEVRISHSTKVYLSHHRCR